MERAWLACARENFEAAVLLVEGGKPRSAVSRAYYAGFAAAHAVLHSVTPDVIGARGNIRHGALHSTLFRALTLAGRSELVAKMTADRLNKVYTHRVAADYKPDMGVSREAVGEAISAARELIRSAGGMANDQ